MGKSNDSSMPQPFDANSIQPSTPSQVDNPYTPTRTLSSANQNQYSMIGKSIVIKGEIAASDPVYIYGCVEGSISAPAHRVTVGKEGRVKADITAREVVIMGDVCGNLNGGERVEIRSEGSLMGDLATNRVFIEDGALLQGSIDVCGPGKEGRTDAVKEPGLDSEQVEPASAAEPQANGRIWDTVAVPELG